MGTEILHTPIIESESQGTVEDRFRREIVIPWLIHGQVIERKNIDEFRGGLIGRTSNTVEIAKLKQSGVSLSNRVEVGVVIFEGVDGILLAVWRPESGESRQRCYDWNITRMWPREEAAYILDEALGFNIVPPTVSRPVDGEMGSLRLYINHEIADAPRLLPDVFNQERFLAGLDARKIAAFDYITGNLDREIETNVLVAKADSRIGFAIDHDAIFPAVKQREADIKGPRDHYRRLRAPLPEAIVAGLESLLSQEEAVRKKLHSDILVRFERDGESAFDRARQLLKAKHFL